MAMVDQGSFDKSLCEFNDFRRAAAKLEVGVTNPLMDSLSDEERGAVLDVAASTVASLLQAVLAERFLGRVETGDLMMRFGRDIVRLNTAHVRDVSYLVERRRASEELRRGS